MTRRRATLLAAGALGMLATVTGAVAVANGRHTTAALVATRADGRVPWIVLEAGHGATSLVIRYKAVSCPAGPAQARVTETNEQIAITVIQKHAQVDPSKPCERMAVTPQLRVHLRGPIAGRQISGEGYPWPLKPGSVNYLARSLPDPPHPAIELPLVPRMLGLSPTEATAVLNREGFRTKLAGARTGEITVQSPARGHLAPGSTRRTPYEGEVTLTVGP